MLIDGERVRVGSRAFDILLTLMDRAGEVVTKNDILAAVWPGYVVDDNNLAVHISALRRLLGPGAISTVPGSGYRLTLPTRATLPPVGAPPTATGAPVVGRQPDIDSLNHLVRHHALVSLVGAAGIGKSTLAQRVVLDLRDSFLHGAAWCDLDTVVDPEAVCGRIAVALSLRQTSADLLGAVCNALRPQSMLLVLDGAERVVDEVARVVGELLRAAPGVRILVTSQLPLRLEDEQVLRLQPLSIPASTATADEALGHGSVQFFVRRAAQASEGFQLTDTNVADVITICRRLDGIPLAIELAAARAATLGTGTLAGLLDHRFRLLRSFNRSISTRHVTLKSALEWSLGMLTADERVVFRRIGVFPRSFSAEMLAAVASGDGLDPGRVAAVLRSLVDKSLVHAEPGRPQRLRLLESTRSLAQEHLQDAGELATLRRRHAQAVLARFQAAMADVHGNRMPRDDIRAALEDELDDAHAALTWALAHDTTAACALMPGLSFAAAESRFRETQALWESTEEFVDHDLPASIQAEWALGCALFWWNRNVDAMDRWATRAAELCEALGDADGRHTAQAARLVVAARRGVGVEDHRARLDRLADPALSLESRRYGASARAIAAAVGGRPHDAAEYLTETLALAHLLGDSLNVANARINLLDTALALGHIDDAIAHGESAVTQLRDERRRGVLGVLGVAQLNLASAYAAKGMDAAVFELAREAWPLAVAEGLQPYWADYLALACATAGRSRDAAHLLGFGDTGYAGYHMTRVANERAAAQRAEGIARDALGSAAFDAARRDGRRFGADEVYGLLAA